MIVKYGYMDNLLCVSYSWNIWLWGKQVWIEHFDNASSGYWKGTWNLYKKLGHD
jgi:hypothetical protein